MNLVRPLSGLFVALALLYAPAVAGAVGAPRDGRGILHGTVRNATNGVPLEGAVVTAVAGGAIEFARSGPDGSFELELTPGSHLVTLAHPGYREENLGTLVVAQGGVREADVEMAPQGSASEPKAKAAPSGNIEEMVVKGEYIADSLDQIRFSESVLDVLSADDFSVTADSSVVDALARVTGVSVVDDKYVYVRGLGERYSNTLFNSALLPSPEPTRRVVPLDLFPSGVMEQLSVQKTYAPYLPADFSGGSIQLTTRAIPVESEAKMEFSVEYNSETTFQDSLWYEGDGSDWTGFEGGYREFPGEIRDLSVDGRLPAAGALTDEQLRLVGLAINRDYTTDHIDILPNFGLDASYSNAFDTRIGSLGFLLGARYKNKWSKRQERALEYPVSNFGNERCDPFTEVSNCFTRDVTTNTISYAGLATAEWVPDDDHVLKSTLFLTRFTDKRLYVDKGYFFENDLFVLENNWEWEERQLWSAQVTGDHLFSRWKDVGVDWGVTYGTASRDKPDSRFFRFERSDEGAYTLARGPGSNRRQWEELTDDAWDLFLDLRRPFDLTESIRTTAKTGMKLFTKQRESSLRRFRFNPRFPTSEFTRISRLPIDEIFVDDNIGRNKWTLEESTVFSDSYDAEETIWAGYLQFDTEIGPRWTWMVGARYEASTQTTETRDPSGGAPITNTLEDPFWLPATSLTWSFRDDMQLRAGFSQTLNRPDLRELSDATYVDPETFYEYRGNPDLTIATINNYDLRWEWYYGGSNNLQIAAFYKEFTDPIEVHLQRKGSRAIRRSFENADSAWLYGLELALRQDLDPLGEWARNFYTKLNGSYMQSEVTIPETSLATNKKRPLQGQPDWVTNAQLTYDNLLLDLQATIAFNMSAAYIVDAGIDPYDDASKQPEPTLDFILGYGFDLWDRRVSLKLEAKNLLDPSFEVVRAAAGAGGREIVEREYKKGRTFAISIEREF